MPIILMKDFFDLKKACLKISPNPKKKPVEEKKNQWGSKVKP